CAGRYAQLFSECSRPPCAAPQRQSADDGAAPRPEHGGAGVDGSGFYSERGPRGARAENVAWGCATEGCAMQMWANSSGHRANMLLTDVKSYGLASASAGKNRYWCLVLGR